MKRRSDYDDLGAYAPLFRRPALGRPRSLSRSTIYRKLALYRRFGESGLARKRRSDAGMPKVEVSRAWDRSVPFSAEDRREIVAALLFFVDQVGEASLRDTAKCASDLLFDITCAAGCRLDRELCRLDASWVKRQRALLLGSRP